MEGIKPLSCDLIRDLDAEFPPLRPNEVLSLSDKELAYKAGQRAVVDFLKQLQQQQELR